MNNSISLLPKEVHKLMQTGEIRLIDVREKDEFAYTSVTGSDSIPMSEFGNHLGNLSKDQKLAFICRSGARSGRVVMYLRSNGFPNVYNVTGGIIRWSNEVDPSVKKY